MVVLAVMGLALIAASIRMIRRPSILTFLAVVVSLLTLAVFVGPLTNRMYVDRFSAVMANSRTMALAEFQYANDHDGAYPDGNSSTEVFQKLLDEHYVSNSTVFYVPMAGKTPLIGLHLRPENVGYDTTGGVHEPIPQGLPLVFITGYRIDYRHGGKATVIERPQLGFLGTNRSWWKWLNFTPASDFVAPVLRQQGSAYSVSDFSNAQVPVDSSRDFDESSKTYRQLTPSGMLN